MLQFNIDEVERYLQVHMESSRNANKMGKWGATSYLIGNIVGSGVFITPTSILSNTSSKIWCRLCILMPRQMESNCICIYGWSEYIIQGLHIEFCNEQALFITRKLIGFSLVWLLLFLNFFSLRASISRFQMVASLAKVLSAAVIIVTGLFYLFIRGETQNLRKPFENSTVNMGKLANAFFAGLFSYDGWDILNFGAEEVDNPKKTMSFAILFGISCVAVLYISINLSYFVVLTVPQIESSVAVATTFSKASLGSFQYSIPFLVSILLVGSLNSTLFAASRYLLAASRERQLPAFISCVNIKHNSPRAALFFHATLAILFSFLGNIEELINYVAFAQWMQRSFTLCALLYIRLCNLSVHPEAIRTPLVMPIAFLGVCLALVSVTIAHNFKTSLVGLMMLAVGLLIYVLFLWEKSLQRFESYRRTTSALNEYLCVFSQIAFNGIIDVSNEPEKSKPLKD